MSNAFAIAVGESDETLAIKSKEDLGKVGTSDLLRCHNELTGKKTSKFASRAKGIEQTWAAIQEVAGTPVETVVAEAKTVGVQSKIDKSARIATVAANPKRAGSSAGGRYDLYKVGGTIGDYLEAGGFLADVRWDLSKGFITLEEKAD